MSRWCIAVALVAGPCLAQSNCRLYLAGQYDWGGKTGFYIDFEGPKLATLPIILGAADGSQWQFVSHTPEGGFLAGRDYAIAATFSPGESTLSVNRTRVATIPGPCQFAGKQPLGLADRPSWANEPGDWVAVARSLTVRVTRSGAAVEERSLGGANADRSPRVLLFAAAPGEATTLSPQPGDTVTVDATLRFEQPDIHALSPLVDRYGQCAEGDWVGKVHTDDELRADIAAEDAALAKMPPSTDFDRYGGWLKAGWKEVPTAFFRAVRHDGKWWLLTPEGNPCFYVGVSSFPGQLWETTPVSGREFIFEWLPPKDGPFAAARSANAWGISDGTEYACFYAANLIRKYGDAWQDESLKRGTRRLRAWGFSGAGKWGAPPSEVECPVLGRWGAPSLVRHPDIFDPAVREQLRAALESQIAPRKSDPRVIGWSVGNEYDEIVNSQEARDVLRKPGNVPAKKALVARGLETLYGGDVAKMAAAWKVTARTVEELAAATETSPPAADVEKLRCFYAERYYEFLYTTIKAIDPNHLYLGNWIVPGWWENEEDWRILARYCDVIGYDRYALQFRDDLLARLEKETDKPILCGEYSFPAFYGGTRGFGRYPCFVEDDAEAGMLYERWVRDAAADPYCVGVAWFIYRDQPITGRGAGHGAEAFLGEHYAFGLVTETDRPKWPLVDKVREANLNAAGWRTGAR